VRSLLRYVLGARSKSATALGEVALELYRDLGTLSLIEVSDAHAIAGNLFRQAFRAEVPRQPRHFVLVRPVDEAVVPIGYVHYTRKEDAYLAGGLVVSALEFRRFDSATASLVRQEGGLAEWIMRTTCGWLNDVDAIFAYMGDKKSIKVNLRVGFSATEHRHLHVLWKKPLSEARRDDLIRRIAAIGPF
jgi:hypothetical protein